MEFVDTQDVEMCGCGEGWVLDNLERLHDNSYLLRERRDSKIRLATAMRKRKMVVAEKRTATERTSSFLLRGSCGAPIASRDRRAAMAAHHHEPRQCGVLLRALLYSAFL
jgi:hypothetical protein